MFDFLLTHRGIDVPLGEPLGAHDPEGTLQKFYGQLKLGFGVEFDVRPMSDGEFAVAHDENLIRITGGKRKDYFANITSDYLKLITLRTGEQLATLSEILDAIICTGASISALHLKGACQEPNTLKNLVEIISPFCKDLQDKLIIFDASIDAAEFLKNKIPAIKLAASVSHDYDIERFGGYVKNTLLSVSQALERRDLYDWVWLDEWDKKDANGNAKSLVTPRLVNHFAERGFGVAAVSLELHAISPGLLGGEAHEWGCSKSKLLECWSEWNKLGVKALCTDHASWIKTNMDRIACTYI